VVIKSCPPSNLSFFGEFLIYLPSVIPSPSVMLQTKVQLLQDLLPVRLTFFLSL
jgi:hypothetical protein